jgi:hypothetical protein
MSALTKNNSDNITSICINRSMGEERKVYKVLVGTPEGKIPLGRPRRR